MKKILTLILSVLIHYCSFSQEGPDSTFIIRDAGFSVYDDYDIIRDSIAKDWNIEFRLVGNCTESEKFRDSIKTMNDRTE